MNAFAERGNPPKFVVWLKIARLHFYPMAWIAYGLGATCAVTQRGLFHLETFLAGLFCLFLIECVSVLLNEYYDYGTDVLNENGSLFSGGSRVLVEHQLSFQEVRMGIFAVSLLFVISVLLLLLLDQTAKPMVMVGTLLLGLVLGVGYTAPPLKFCYRGLGEFVVSFTHSIYVVVAGFVFQTGNWNSPDPWLLAVPLFFAVYAAITLSGLPDYQADKAVSKKTAAVLLNPQSAARIAFLAVLLAVASALLLVRFGYLKNGGFLLLFISIPHAFALLFFIARIIKDHRFNRRIDKTMKLALTFILWFGVIPLLCLLWR